MKQLNDFFSDKKIETILDVGTGTGDFAAVLKTVFPNAGITGIDPNSDALSEAREKFPHMDFLEMNGESLGFEDNSFDLAAISMALHHLPDVLKTLREMQRVVKPGGWIIVNELFSDNLNQAQEVHKFYHHFRSYTDRLRGETHNETFTKGQILQMVELSGIEVQKHFEVKKGENRISKPEDIEIWANKMEKMLEPFKEHPEYEELLPQIDEFRRRAAEHGLQPATKVVVIGKPWKS